MAAGGPRAAAGMPVIGFLNSTSPSRVGTSRSSVPARSERDGLCRASNVGIEWRWAEGRYERLPALAADLVRRQVALIIATGGHQVALAAKTATDDDSRCLHQRFRSGEARPRRQSQPTGRQLTGAASICQPDGRQAPGAAARASSDRSVDRCTAQSEQSACGNPVEGSPGGGASPRPANSYLARKHEAELEAAFATAGKVGAGALLVAADPYFNSRRTTIHRVSGAPSHSCDLRAARARPSRRPDELRHQPVRRLSPSRHLHWPNPQRREARRSAGDAVRPNSSCRSI